ncbi:hypothetical protein PT974_00051 [Cladobotryum mycophilum]|uniref:Oxidase ustYa n=1 Tax=Cladobotryum mycophilum TaxID=491253 RepID=A0ABR0T154_9HYPO
MAPKEYAALSQHESGMNDSNISGSSTDNHQKSWLRIVLLLSIALLTSILANIFFVCQWSRPLRAEDGLTQYARLARDVPFVRGRNSTYDHPDRTVEDAAWEADIVQPYNGFVALDDNYVKSVGLPHSMRSPWDEDKGVYILSSSHEIHCVHVLRDTVNQGHDGKAYTWPHPHVMHCLNVLRETVMCNADDEPLYTGALHAQLGAAQPRAGIGSVRKCRDWNKLQDWARERSACWKPYKMDDPNLPLIERYKFCPDGSKPWERLEKSS